MVIVNQIDRNVYYLKIPLNWPADATDIEVLNSTLEPCLIENAVIYIDLELLRELPDILFNAFHSLVPQAARKTARIIFINAVPAFEERINLLSSSSE